LSFANNLFNIHYEEENEEDEEVDEMEKLEKEEQSAVKPNI